MNKILAVVAIAELALAAGCNKNGNDVQPLPGGAPPDPSSLAQSYKDGVTRLRWGKTTGEGGVMFSAAVAGVPDSLMVRLNVEVVPLGMPFTGRPTSFSAPVASGTVAMVFVPLTQAGGYSWCAWTQDSYDRASGIVTHLEGPGAAFIVDPAAPSELQQFALDGVHAVGVGQTTPEIGVVLEARAHSADGNMARAQFEIKPVDVAFDGSSLILGSVGASGDNSKATAMIAPGVYHWRSRSEDVAAVTSGWVEFGGNEDLSPADPDVQRIASAAGSAPNAPSALSQMHSDGATAIPAGGTTSEASVVFIATQNDPADGPCALEVEVKPMSAPLDGTGTFLSPFLLSGAAARVVVPLGADSYHWQARSVGPLGAASAWSIFANYYAPGAADFIVAAAANTPPNAPTALAQYQADGVTGMAAGETLSQRAMVVAATISDPDFANGLVLEVEVKPWGQPFAGFPSAASDLRASGSAVTLILNNLQAGAAYHWQARAIDQAGAASAWVEYAGATASISPSSPSGPPPAGGGGSGCSGTISVKSEVGAFFWVLLAAALLFGCGARRTRQAL